MPPEQEAPIQNEISSEPVVVDTAEVEDNSQEQEIPIQIDTSTESQNSVVSGTSFVTGSGTLSSQLVLFLMLLIVISKRPARRTMILHI